MTITQAIAGVDALRPANPYTAAQKTAWLNSLDGRLYLGVVCGAEEGTPVYTEAEGNVELLVPPPFDGLYPVYLAAQIDFADTEWDAYAASSRMFNELCGEYARYYLRKNRPASSRVIL